MHAPNKGKWGHLRAAAKMYQRNLISNGDMYDCVHVCVPLCRHHVIIAQLRKRQPLLFEWECECECACCERNRKLQAKDVGIYDKSLGNVLLTTHQAERLPPGQCSAQRRIQWKLRRLKQSQLVNSLLLFWLQVSATVCSLSKFVEFSIRRIGATHVNRVRLSLSDIVCN